MKHAFSFSLLAASLFLTGLSCAPAQAQITATKTPDREPVTMKEDLQARERGIASTFLGYWLDGNKDGKLETSVVDLNGDGTAEVFIRLVHPSSCDVEMKTCRTIALMHNGSEWKSVFDRPAATIELGKPGQNNMRAILINGYENRTWNGKAYQIDLATMKTTTPKFQIADATRGLELSRGFGNAAESLFKAKRVAIDTTDIKLGGHVATVVRLEGEPACGIYIGCPIRVLVPDSTGRAVPILETSSRVDAFGKPEFKVTAVERAGWPSMIVTMPDGTPLVADWDGRRYQVEPRR